MPSHVGDVIEFTPLGGWNGFSLHEQLSNSIWCGLSEADGRWAYVNLTSGSSIWECQIDGSFISMFYLDDGNGPLVELLVFPGIASAYMQPIAESFGLLATPSPKESTRSQVLRHTSR